MTKYRAFKVGTRVLLGEFNTLEEVEAYVKDSSAYTTVMSLCKGCGIPIQVEPASAGPMEMCLKCSQILGD